MKKNLIISRADIKDKNALKKATATRRGDYPKARDREALAELIKKIKAM